MTNIKLRIEGDRILTDTGVEVGYGGYLGDAQYGLLLDGCVCRYKTLPEAEAAYNAHLREVLGDRVVVSREDAGVCVKALDLAAAIMNSINGTLDDNGTMALRGIANKIRAMLKEADHD